jgi:hypothetical protein
MLYQAFRWCPQPVRGSLTKLLRQFLPLLIVQVLVYAVSQQGGPGGGFGGVFVADLVSPRVFRSRESPSRAARG